MQRAWVIAAAVLGFAGCGSIEYSGTCSFRSSGTLTLCGDYEASVAESQKQAACASIQGVYAPGTCPSASRVGRCFVSTKTSSGTVINTVQNYYSPGTTAVMAEQGCQQIDATSDVTAHFEAN